MKKRPMLAGAWKGAKELGVSLCSLLVSLLSCTHGKSRRNPDISICHCCSSDRRVWNWLWMLFSLWVLHLQLPRDRVPHGTFQGFTVFSDTVSHAAIWRMVLHHLCKTGLFGEELMSLIYMDDVVLSIDVAKNASTMDPNELQFCIKGMALSLGFPNRC